PLCGTLERALGPTVEARRRADRAVDLDHVPRARALVQAVDVLGHDRLDEPSSLELGERKVPGVRLRLRQDTETQRVELPDLLGVAPEGVDRRVLHRVVLRPDPTRRAEGGKAALRGDPDAR